MCLILDALAIDMFMTCPCLAEFASFNVAYSAEHMYLVT